jgi:hypothetical protein
MEARRVGNRRARELLLRQADEADWERVRTQPRPAESDPHARGIGARRLQLIIVPSFEPASVWDVRQVCDAQRGHEWQLIRPRVVATEPSLLVVGHELVPLPSAKVAEYFDRVTALTLPLRPDLSGELGADGTLYELSVAGDLCSGWRFRWWSHWPEQWRPLVGVSRGDARGVLCRRRAEPRIIS